MRIKTMKAGTWRVLENGADEGDWNMAVDEALMHFVRSTGASVLRIYAWSTPTLSFGRNQRAVGEYDPARLRAAGVRTVRRPTGGRAVLHASEVTYAVVAPEDRLGSLKDSYSRINAMLLRALDRLGVHATVAEGNVASEEWREAAHSPAPCFDQPSRGELTLAGRKLVGSAQWRDGGVLLQHGSILTGDDQSRIAEFLTTPVVAASTPATLGEQLGRTPDLVEVAQALRAALHDAEGVRAMEMGLHHLPAQDLARAREKYADEAWTWRR
jgi:lipoate-protein ligase A